MSRKGRWTMLVAWLIAGAGCGQDHDPAVRPYELFDRAEAARASSDHTSAHAAYRELVEWAASDPLQDGWGGSGLVPYAFWRWTQYVRQAESPDPRDVDAMLAADQALRNTRLVTGIFSSAPQLDALPQLREERWKALALLAEDADQTDAARYLFLDYLAVTREPVLQRDAAALRNRMIADGWATAEGLDLMLANRHRELRDHGEALRILEHLADSAQANVLQQARLNLAQTRWDTRRDSETRREVYAVLSSVIDDARNPDVLQQAYYLRGQVQARVGVGQSIPGFIADMEALVREFPNGAYADEALSQLAANYDARFRQSRRTEHLDAALSYYDRLREFPTPHDREDSMYFRPAMALYTRSLLNEATRAADLGRAAELLDQLNEAKPDGPFWLASLFWRARIADLRGNLELADGLYDQLLTADPYGYYGIRALMHLRLADDAPTLLLPTGAAREHLAGAIQTPSPRDVGLPATTPYHERLRRFLVQSDRYLHALNRLRDFRTRTARPLHDASIADLDDRGELAEVVLLLALRQDAHAALAADRRAPNVVAVAAAVGHAAADWPLALTLLDDVDDRAVRIAVRQHDIYIPTAYPNVDLDRFAAAAAAAVAPELLYSIARRESRFSVDAVSRDGAVGLFQLMPRNFCVIAQRWGLLDNPLPVDECMDADRNRMFHYLADTDRSIALGGRWLREELLPRYPATDAGSLFALMDHNAGAPAVAAWRAQWDALGQASDVEYMVETAGFPETRRLVRGILADIAVVDAAGLFHRPDASR